MRISDWSSDVCSSDLAEAADQSTLPDGVNLPDEIARREDRLAAIAEAKAAIEARARERDAHEQAVYQAKLAQREAKRKATGKKPGDRKSTRLNSVTNAHLVCRLLLEKKKQNDKNTKER